MHGVVRLFFGLTVLLITQLALAGWSSNGGDLIRDQNNPWYIGDAVVTYCVEVSSSYPVAKSALQEIVRESLVDWRRFFEKYDLDSKEFGAADLKFKDGQKRKLSLSFQEATDCLDQKGEPRSEKLVFLFDVKNAVVKQVQNSGSANALGLSIRHDFNHESYRNGGIVWIASFSADRAKLKHMVLHEIGHIFGMRHNSVFVMDEFVSAEVTNPVDAEALGQIESSRWKYRMRNGDSIEFSSEYGGGIPNAGIPEELRNTLRLKKEDTHKFHMLYQEIGTHLKQRRFTVTMENGRESRILFWGNFGYVHAEQTQTLGPSLYTEWTAKGFARSDLDTTPSTFPANGSFQIMNSNYASVISGDRGPALKIFAPYSTEWWSISGRTPAR